MAATSAAKNFPNCSGVIGVGSTPSCCSLSRIAGMVSAVSISRRRNRKRNHFALLDQRQRRRDRQEIKIDPTGHQIGQRFGRAAIGDVLDLKPRREAKALASDMRGRADSSGGEI
jgi:hypothetical protein